ncbi:olfactory receptor 2AP1-like [Hemicordylus capensis]|uniref:olfactory receptor 2AP1-like n=1 Tax=Hemicordylus capensis TaxID=884348 RepID=UPI0023045149|nr:olfactory receptor 2AP1-like [Hemicordylus capensis]
MEVRDNGNQSTVTWVILMGFGDLQQFQFLLFVLFLAVYIVTLLGNLILIVLVVTDQHLHTPMYFFLGNLSSLEICYSSTIVPRLLNTLVADDKTVSLSSCLVQFFFFAFLLGAESHLLSVMSYDRYVAICKPLHYATFMSTTICIRLSTISWINGFIASIVLQFLIMPLTFCGPNEIDHYVCDNGPLIKLSCSDTSQVELATCILAFIFTIPPLSLTLASYAYIITTILKIPSSTGRKKAFSTCSSHLIVVSSYYLSVMIVYMLPKTEDVRRIYKIMSLLYTVLPPLVNPFIYSLRNQEVKEALFRKLMIFKTVQPGPVKIWRSSQK